MDIPFCEKVYLSLPRRAANLASRTGTFSRAVGALPAFAKKGGYKTPDGTFQYANSTTLNLFQWLPENPPVGLYFNNHMGGYSYGRPSWMDAGFYPVQDRLLAGFGSENAAVAGGDGGDGKDPALLVDIGGGLGHDLGEFWKKFL